MELIDIGVNLGHRTFDRDRDQVINRAVRAGVHTMIVTGTTLASSAQAAEMALRYPGALYSTAGVHPHNAGRVSIRSLRENLAALARSAEVVAIGECGLDFNRDFSPRPLQEQVFEAQIHVALELVKPLFLHERDAHNRFIDILTANKREPVRGVVHCFTGNRDQLRAYLDMGLYIGITGWIADERRGADLKDVVRFVPSDRLMLETDAPFLLPSSLRRSVEKGRNEPAFIREVLRTVAAAKNEEEPAVASASTATARELFGLGLPTGALIVGAQ